MMFFGFSVVYGLRVNLSVAMVAMVNTTDAVPAANHSLVTACPLPTPDNSSVPVVLIDTVRPPPLTPSPPSHCVSHLLVYLVDVPTF